MGHFTDTTVVYTDADHQIAYSNWAQQRRDEEGIYASITTRGRLLNDNIYPPSHAVKVVEDYADRHVDSYSGPGVCVAVCREQDIARRTVTLRGTIDGQAWGGTYEDRYEALSRLIADKVALKAGEYIERWSLGTRQEAETGFDGRQYMHDVPDVTIRSKVIVSAPKEKTETRYFVHAPTKARLGLSDVQWENGHPTQAKARAAMVAMLEASTEDEHQMLTVTALTRRESGAALVTAERKVIKAQLVVKVTVAKMKAGARAGGWAMAMRFHK